MNRRELLQGALLAIGGSGVAQAETGPFANPTATFRAGGQHELPAWAFTNLLEFPAVPLPTAVGRFESLHHRPVFGPQDSTELGGAFHGIAREWGETPPHWQPYGCDPGIADPLEAWRDKREHFGTVQSVDGGDDYCNWAGFQIKCYKIPIEEGYRQLRHDRRGQPPARYYGYGGVTPAPTFKMRLGEPAVVRFENHLEAEMSIHLHGGHSPSHSDGFPTFYVLQGKARDYFYPNILPLYQATEGGPFTPDIGESQSTMWYHDHALDATGYNVSKGLAGFALCFGERELQLIRDRVLPGYGPDSCLDPTRLPYDAPESVTAEVLKRLEDPGNPGYFKNSEEPYRNPFDIPLVLQDKVIDQTTGQIAFSLTDHNGYLGDTFFVNGVAWPWFEVRNRKYRFRILDGSNARVYRLRLMTMDDYLRARESGIESLEGGAVAGDRDLTGNHGSAYDAHSFDFLRIGKDSWLWSRPKRMKTLVLAMANRADIVVDFNALTGSLGPTETKEFVLVNTMPQSDGRGPRADLEDGGDPRVLPIPFDLAGEPFVELTRPIGLMKFVVRNCPPGQDPTDKPGDAEASISEDSTLITNHRRIPDHEVTAVRQFIFERGKGAWQVNGRFYDPFLTNASPMIDRAEEWVLRNEGGGWWHPIHIHLESHQLIRYEKDFEADRVIDRQDPPAPNRLQNLQRIDDRLAEQERLGLHDTQVLGPNTQVRIRIRTRTWTGPFVFHCHNLEHEDMRMMFNFEPAAGPPDSLDGTAPPIAHDPNVAPDQRTHGNDVTLGGSTQHFDRNVGELPWHYASVPTTPLRDAGVEQIKPRPKQ